MVDGHSVLIAHPEAFRPVDLAKALAAVRRVPLQDAVLEARSCWGILGEGLTDLAASEIADRFSREGIPALPFPAERIQVPADPVEARTLALEDSCLRVPGIRPGDAGALPWDDAVLVAAAVFPESAARITPAEAERTGQRLMRMGWMLATGLPAPPSDGNAPRRAAGDSDLAFYLDIVFRDPAGGLRVRVKGDRFDYHCLGESKSYGSFGNFRNLAMDVSRRARSAWSNRGVRTLAAGAPVRQLEYRGVGDLDRECRWLLTLRAHGMLERQG